MGFADFDSSFRVNEMFIVLLLLLLFFLQRKKYIEAVCWFGCDEKASCPGNFTFWCQGTSLFLSRELHLGQGVSSLPQENRSVARDDYTTNKTDSTTNKEWQEKERLIGFDPSTHEKVSFRKNNNSRRESALCRHFGWRPVRDLIDSTSARYLSTSCNCKETMLL